MKLKHIVLFIGIATTVLTSSASARPYALEEEVIVTSRMRPESLQEVPIAISVIDSQVIERHGDTLQEIEYAVPSLGFGRTGRRTRGELSIRGVGDFARNIGTESRVLVYVDSVLVGRSSAFDQELDGVERIEILKGPQGSLYGANAIAGAINIITKKPNNDFGFSVLGTYGNLDNKVGLSANIPFTQQIQSNIYLSHKEDKGYIDNLTLDTTIGDMDTQSGRARTVFDFNEGNLLVDLGIYFMDQEGNGSDSVALPGGAFGGYTRAPDERDVAHNTVESEERDLFGLHLNTDLHLGAYTISQLIGYRDNQHEQSTDQDYSPLDIASNTLNEQLKQHTYELRLVSPQEHSFSFVSGLYYLDQDITTTSRADGGALFINPNTSATIPSSVDVDSISFYTNTQYTIHNDLKLTLGGRLISDKRSILYNSRDTTGFFINVNDLAKSHSTQDFVPNLQLSWQNRGLLVYSNLSKGHKSAGWNADGIASLEHFDFDAESAIHYEIGLKNASNPWRYSLATYLTRYQDFQVFQIVPTSDAGSILTITNAAQVTSKGIEFEGEITLGDFIALTALAYNKAEFDTFKDAGGEDIHYDGHRLPYAPYFTSHVSLTYNKRLSKHFNIQSSVSYSYIGSYFSNPSNLHNTYISSRDIVNLSSKLMFKETTELSFWIKNLLDKTNLRSSDKSFLREPRGVYEPPRSLGVTLSHSL